MKELKLPHKAPIRFAKHIVSKENDTAIIKVKFGTLPTLPMMVEAAAQSSAAFGDEKNSIGFLVSLKNVKLFEKPSYLEYDVEVSLEYKFEEFRYLNFKINGESALLASGTFMIAINR